MALSLLCGGLGVAEAAVVHVNEGTGVTHAVYTTDETYTQAMVDEKLNSKADKTDVVQNTKDIATNKGNITKLENNKLDKALASETYATKTALGEYAKTAYVDTEVGKKADKTYVDNAVANVDTKLASYATRTELDTKLAGKANKATTLAGYEINDAYTKDATDTAITTKVNEEKNARELEDSKLSGRIDTLSTTVDSKVSQTDLNTTLGNYYTQAQTNAAIRTAVDDEKNARENAINGEVTNRNKAIDDAIAREGTNRDAAIAKEETKRKEEDAKLEGKITENTTAINNEKTDREAAVTDLSKRIGTVDEDGKYIKKSATNNVSENLKVLDTQANNNAEAIKQETADRKAAIGELAADGKYIKRAKNVSENLVELDTQAKTNAEAIAQEAAKREEEDNKINTKIGSIDNNQTEYVKEEQTISQNLTKLDKELKDTNDRTRGITRNLEKTQTTIEGAVKVDKQGNVKDVKGLSAETITTGALNVTGESNLKNTTVDGTLSVNKETTLNDKLTANGEATFGNDVTVKGTTNLKGTTVDGDLKVTGTITTDRMVFGDPATNNYTEIDHGKVTSKNSVVNGEGQKITSSSIFNAEENKVGFANNATGDQSFHKQTSDIIMDNVKDRDNSNYRTQTKTETKDIITDENGNSSTTSQTASKNETSLKDKDGKNTNKTIDTATGYDKTIEGENGKTSTKQEAGSISSTVYDKDGKVKASSEMKEDGSISNNATGDLTTKVGGNELHEVTGTKTENVTGKVTENYNGGQETKVTGDKKTTVTGKTTEEYKGGLETTVTGDEKHTVTGNQTTNVTGDISNTAKNITNKADEKLTDQVGDNTRVTTSTSITDTVGTKTNRKIEDGKITDTAGDFTVTTDEANGTTFAKTGGSAAYSTETGAPTDTNIAGNLITTGRVKANELKVSDKDDHGNTADLSVEAGEGVKASAGNGTTTGSLDVKADEVGSSVTDASGKGSTFKQRIDAIMMASKNVSIKADETLTNEAKVITNKASEVINNEAININNTATGIITSKASEIKNQADKLISNKVGENTSEYMEDGKITTSIKDGAKSTVTIQNADGLQTGVTNGTSTNASATTATSSAQTIASGGKANSVITTIDGTQFVNTDAATPVTGESGAGTADRTTIKGNTITTGKVKMDYAEVMKDLGVHGSAKVDNNLEVGGTSTLKGDVTMESNATVKKDLTVKGTTNLKNTNVDGNLDVTGNAAIHGNQTIDGTLKVTKKATFEDSVDIAKDLSVIGDVTANSYKVGGNTYIDVNGINANNQKITNVADGSISEGSKDAVNGGQLYGMKMDLEHKVDKVGANAAAMANLHPMEFDPDSKWNIAAAMGNYGSETATAIGAFYRPNEDVMVNFSTAFGTGENMVGGGVSVRLGKGSNKLSREESNALKDQVDDLTARMDALLSVLNPNMSKDFPDVPENHWAYEAVSRLAGNDIVQGYPDGEFHGERTMTRYEMAEIIYNALSRGAEAERELVEEFKPELQAMAASEKATAERAEG